MEQVKTSVSETKKAGGKRLFTVSTMVKIAILSAVAVVVMLFSFPLPLIPGFYKLDFSEVIVLIGAFALGPVAGVLIELLKVLLNLLINGTITAGIGELANFIIGVSFVLPAALLYRHKKSLKTALLGMAAGTLAMTAVGSLVNLYLLLPAYSAMVMPMDAIIAMGTKLNGSITGVGSLVLLATAPFNLLKGLASSLIAALLYKHISPLLHK